MQKQKKSELRPPILPKVMEPTSQPKKVTSDSPTEGWSLDKPDRWAGGGISGTRQNGTVACRGKGRHTGIAHHQKEIRLALQHLVQADGVGVVDVRMDVDLSHDQLHGGVRRDAVLGDHLHGPHLPRVAAAGTEKGVVARCSQKALTLCVSAAASFSLLHN